MSDELQPSMALSTDVNSRRAHVRFEVLGQIEAHSVWRLRPIMLRDLSTGGFSLEATGPFEAGMIYKFRIGIEGQRRSMIVQAMARHCTLVTITADLPIYVAGFQLHEPSEAVLREMASLTAFAESIWNAQTDS